MSCATNCSLKLTAKGYEHLPVSKRKVKRKLIKYKGKWGAMGMCMCLGNTVNVYGAIAQCEWANGTADKETGGPTRTTRWFTSQMVNARLSGSARESDTESVHMLRQSGGKWVGISVSLPLGEFHKASNCSLQFNILFSGNWKTLSNCFPLLVAIYTL